MKESEQNPVLRENFGPGKFGEIAYQTILVGTPCEAFVEETGERCGGISDRTVDLDIRGNAHFITACSSKHEARIKARVIKEAEQKGSEIIPDFSRNGWGRELTMAKPGK